MTTLRSKIIRLAHQQPSLRPHLLPLLSDRTAAASSVDAALKLVDRAAAQSAKRVAEIHKIMADLKGLQRKVENADRVATKKFNALLWKLVNTATTGFTDASGFSKAISSYLPSGGTEEADEVLAWYELITGVHHPQMNGYLWNFHSEALGGTALAHKQMYQAEQLSGAALVLEGDLQLGPKVWREYARSLASSKTAASPLDRARGHVLMPKSVKVPRMRAQENTPDPIAYVKFFSPYSGATWYITEWDGANEMFGWADLGHGGGELGYISLPELENANRRGLPLVERDLSFRPTPLSKLTG